LSSVVDQTWLLPALAPEKFSHPSEISTDEQGCQHRGSTESFRCLIHDNDKKLTDAFDDVFQSKQIHVIHTPLEAPNANSFAERWVLSARSECLDHVLILNEAHLRRVLQTYIEYYNTRRPHQSLEQQSPIPYSQAPDMGAVKKRQLLGGILNDYFRAPGNNDLSP